GAEASRARRAAGPRGRHAGAAGASHRRLQGGKVGAMRLSVRIVAVMIAAVLFATAARVVAGDRLSEALRLYDDAMYTRALEVLDQLAADQPSAALHQYRALCYIALGRPDAAERA